jgi:hypothetical protein
MKREHLQKIMRQAWQMVKRNGFTMAEALRIAWLNFKLRAKMANGIVKFYFEKIDGTLREAYGTLKSELLPESKSAERKHNPMVQVYYDTEKREFRCFKVANLARIA